MMRLFAIFFTALLILAETASAQIYQRPDDMDYFKQKKAPALLEADSGYIYVRLGKTTKKWVPAPTFIRQLSDNEIANYEAIKKEKFAKAQAKNERKRAKRIAAKAKAKRERMPYSKSIPPVLTYDQFVFEYKAISNIYSVALRKEYRKTNYGRDMFFKLKPGSYVLYDVGGVCMCLGSVQFEVNAGEITDMGMIVSDVVDRGGAISPYEEIEAVTKNHGIYRTGFVYVASAIRPYKADMGFPAELAGLKHNGAKYRAKGKMPMYFSTMLDRLPAISGVMSYRGDKVVDELTGKVLE